MFNRAHAVGIHADPPRKVLLRKSALRADELTSLVESKPARFASRAISPEELALRVDCRGDNTGERRRRDVRRAGDAPLPRGADHRLAHNLSQELRDTAASTTASAFKSARSGRDPIVADESNKNRACGFHKKVNREGRERERAGWAKARLRHSIAPHIADADTAGDGEDGGAGAAEKCAVRARLERVLKGNAAGAVRHARAARQQACEAPASLESPRARARTTQRIRRY
eukprot:5748465-Pleurochrysis_carterae.AAC.2